MPKVNLAYLDMETGRKESIQVVSELRKYFLVTEGLWVMVVSDENKQFKSGEVKRIRIKPIRLEEEKIMIPCFNTRHAIGCTLSIGGSGKPRKVEQRRVFDQAIFLAVDDGKVEENELIGVVNVLTTVVESSLLANLLLEIRSRIARSPRYRRPSKTPR